MKLTNRLNLPQPIVDAIANATYNKGDADISVSGLWAPMQIRELQEKYPDLEEDASDKIWILFGECMHILLEKAGVKNIERITEERIFVKHKGKVISGKPDSLCLVNNVLQDWKSTKTYSLIKGSREEDWLLQLNTYAWMLRRQPTPRHVDAIQAVAFLLDWSTLEQKRNPDKYPPKAAMVVDIPLLPDEEITRRIEERLALLDAPALPCTPEEMWEKPPIYAVMKPGGTRALKLADTGEEADAWVSLRAKPWEKMYVEARPTKRTRCESYCPVSKVCPQYKAWLEAKPDAETSKSTGGML